jgi:hypothetical protein
MVLVETVVRMGFPLGFPESSMRFYLENPRILGNPYLYLECADDGHSSDVQVGRLNVRSEEHCGVYRSTVVCDDVASHKDAVYQGVNFSGKVVVKTECWWCNGAGCPRCFLDGFVARQARIIEGRLETLTERFPNSVVEHTIVSPCEADRGLPPDVLRKKCREAMLRRGVLGGCEIPHGRSIDKLSQKLVWHFHIHALVLIRGGFDVCRDCGRHTAEDCRVCNGFKGRQMREYEKDGYIVKVEGRRKTIGGSASYQLSHATFHVGLKRFHIVTWFGVASNNKFKSKPLEPTVPCPVCAVVGVKNVMVKKAYLGGEPIVRDVRSPEFRKFSAMDEFDVSGSPNFVAYGGGGSSG